MEQYISLELLHLSDKYRASKQLMGELLANDYEEFGSDGSYFDKGMILDRIPLNTSQRYKILDYNYIIDGDKLEATYILKAFDDYELSFKLKCKSTWVKEKSWTLSKFEYTVLEKNLAPALFIDLQGTLGGEGLGDISQFEFFDQAIEALKLATKSNYRVFITTNQSAIEKGLITMEDYFKHESRIKEMMRLYGVVLDGIYCCPHREANCRCKKPLPGLVEQASDDFDLLIKDSYVIGDMGASDMMLAKKIGSKSILVKTGVGEGSLNEFRHTWDEDPDYVATDIYDAITTLLGEDDER